MLADDEQGRLAEIEAATVAADPLFGLRLNLGDAIRRRRRLYRACWWLLALGAWTVISGVNEARGLISLGTVAATGGCVLTLWAAFTAWRLRLPRP